MYLVFLYHEAVPLGGMYSCKKVFTTEDQCREYIEESVSNNRLQAHYYSISDNILMVYNHKDKSFTRDKESEVEI